MDDDALNGSSDARKRYVLMRAYAYTSRTHSTIVNYFSATINDSDILRAAYQCIDWRRSLENSIIPNGVVVSTVYNDYCFTSAFFPKTISYNLIIIIVQLKRHFSIIINCTQTAIYGLCGETQSEFSSNMIILPLLLSLFQYVVIRWCESEKSIRKIIHWSGNNSIFFRCVQVPFSAPALVSNIWKKINPDADFSVCNKSANKESMRFVYLMTEPEALKENNTQLRFKRIILVQTMTTLGVFLGIFKWDRFAIIVRIDTKRTLYYWIFSTANRIELIRISAVSIISNEAHSTHMWFVFSLSVRGLSMQRKMNEISNSLLCSTNTAPVWNASRQMAVVIHARLIKQRKKQKLRSCHGEYSHHVIKQKNVRKYIHIRLHHTQWQNIIGIRSDSILSII